MKLAQIKVKIVTNPTAAGLETDVTAFLSGSGAGASGATQRQTVSDPAIQFYHDGATHVAAITYTE